MKRPGPAREGLFGGAVFSSNVPGRHREKAASAKCKASDDPWAAGSAPGTNNRALIKAISDLKVFQEYERAFNALTGLPVSLQPVETWQLPHHGKRNENPFCALVSQNSHACAACLQAWEQLCEKAANEPKTITCQAGLLDTAVPVRLGDRLIGYLQTGSFSAANRRRASLTGPLSSWPVGAWTLTGKCSGRPIIPRKW